MASRLGVFILAALLVASGCGRDEDVSEAAYDSRRVEYLQRTAVRFTLHGDPPLACVSFGIGTAVTCRAALEGVSCHD